jgi:twinkle protein
MITSLHELGVKPHHRGDVKVVCPQCSHTRKHKTDPCLSVNVEKGVWNCHNCGYNGSIVKKYEKQYHKPQGELKNVSQPVIDWFAKRGITNQTLLRYRVTEGVDYMPQVSGEVRTIHFNYFLGGELINIKFRDKDKNFKLVSGARLIPFGIDVWNDNDDNTVCIVEGEIDCMSFYEAGIRNVISVPNGASKGSQKLEWLDECLDMFDGKKIYLACDMDEPGTNLRNELSRRLGKENCWIVDLPNKDANETLLEHGKARLLDAYMNARPYPVDGIDDANSVDIMELYDAGLPVGWHTGYDTDFRWYPGQVTTITGIPGHGKSTFVKNVLLRLSDRHGLRFLIYSAEEASTAIALSDMYSIATGKAFFDNNYGPRISRAEIEALTPFMNDHFKYYNLSENELTIEAILSKAKEMVRRYGINGLVIDNMSTVEKGMSNKSDARHHQIQSMMAEICAFAKRSGVHVFLVVHPKKMQEIRTGVYRVPNGYDLGDSSHWFNLTDNGFSIYRNPETGQTEGYKWKIRHRYTGTIGTEFYTFTRRSGRLDSAEQTNNGDDRTKFVGQPIDRATVEGFARLADTT